MVSFGGALGEYLLTEELGNPLDEIEDLSHHVDEPKHSPEQADHPLLRTASCPTPDPLIGVIGHVCPPLLDPAAGLLKVSPPRRESGGSP